MSTRGRKPGSDFMKLIKGANDGVATLPDADESAVQTTSTEKAKPPVGIKWSKALAGNKVAQAEYVRIVKELRSRRKWLDGFSGGIEIYAMAFADWIEAEKMLTSGQVLSDGDKSVAAGKVIVSPKGYPIQNPWLAIRNRAQETMLKVANDYGLTLVSQVRVVDAQLDLFAASEKKGADSNAGGAFAKFDR